jgi:hypothetical protein
MDEKEALIQRRKMLLDEISKINHEVEKINRRLDFLERRAASEQLNQYGPIYPKINA